MYSVDVGLEEAWLNAFNGFDHLYLGSVCEGHPDGSTWASRKCMPILRLSVQSSDAPALQARGDHVQRKISSLFEASPLQGTSTLEHGWSSFDTDEYFIRWMHSDIARRRTWRVGFATGSPMRSLS
jgi:hypothetical protein